MINILDFKGIGTSIAKPITKPTSAKYITTPLRKEFMEVADDLYLPLSTTARSIFTPYTVPTIPIKINKSSLELPNKDISTENLRKGLKYLAKEGTPECQAIHDIVSECFVKIKNKEEAISLFKKQHKSIEPDRAIYILNPSDLQKAELKKIGTSNSYMSEWCQEALGRGTIIDRSNLASMAESIEKNGEKKITIIVPDDFSGSGRSMLINTAQTLNDVQFPNGTDVELVFSPLIATPLSKQAFGEFSRFNIKGLQDIGIFNQDRAVTRPNQTMNDSDIAREFANKFKDKIKIKTAEHIIDALPYYETNTYKRILFNHDLARNVKDILTQSGKGYGRYGANGTMVVTPCANGETLKTPNNNVFGAVPFAILEGAQPENIKRLDTTTTGKWKHMCSKIKEELNSI